MEKKKYEGLALEVVGLNDEDVITTSASDCNNQNGVVCSDPNTGFVPISPPVPK